MSNEEITIDGLDEVANQLEALPNRVAQSAVRPALNAGAQVMEAALDSTTPRDTGELVSAMAHKISVSRNLERMSAIVGPKYMGGHKNTSTDPGVRVKFLEFGTRKMTPRFFMRKAFELGAGPAYDTIVAVLKGILEALPK